MARKPLVYPRNQNPLNPASWKWYKAGPLPFAQGTARAVLLTPYNVTEAVLLEDDSPTGPVFTARSGLSGGSRLLSASADPDQAQRAALAELVTQFEAQNRSQPVLVRLRPLRMEVAASRRGRPGYTWRQGVLVINPRTLAEVHPPCSLTEARHYAFAQWGQAITFEWA